MFKVFLGWLIGTILAIAIVVLFRDVLSVFDCFMLGGVFSAVGSLTGWMLEEVSYGR